MKRILAVGGDPGGAAALAPVLEALSCDSSVRLRVLGYRQAVKLWGDRKVVVEALPETVQIDPTAWLEGEPVHLVLTSTSLNGTDHERTFIRWSVAESVPSLAILDFWANYSARFREEDGGLLFPSFVAVMDDRAKKAMGAEGFPLERLVVTGQPAFDQIGTFTKEWTDERRQHVRASLGAGTRNLLVLFASQPLAEMAALTARAEPELNELAILKCLASALEEISAEADIEILLAVRPHPRQHLEFEDLPQGTKIRTVLAGSEDPWSSVMAADLVIGMTTVLLVEACLLGCVVVSIQPGASPADDPLPTNRCGKSVGVYDLDALPAVLRSLLLDADSRSRLREANAEAPPSGATENVLQLMKRILARSEMRA